MTERVELWDDARLEAAFAARQGDAAAAPTDLVAATLDRIGRRPAGRAPGRMQRLAPILGLAAALAIVVGLTAGRLATSPPAASATPGSPNGSAASPSSSTTANRQPGEPLTVSAALEVRGLASDDREIMVAGFLSPWFPLPCPVDLGPPNPTRLVCPDSFQYLMEQPEHLRTTTGTTTELGPPRGPAIHPSFTLVTRPDVPDTASGDSDTAPVVLVGHFDDRRAALCPGRSDIACSDVFAVDQVASVAGRPVGVATRLLNQHWDAATQTNITEQPIDLEADVDRLVLEAVPGSSILSRQLVTIDQAIGIEPALADDSVVPHFNPAALMWIVTILDAGDAPKARAFALIDGSNWFAELTATGAVNHERSSAGPQLPGSGPPAGSADPTAFATAPSTVAGIDVRDVATVMRDRRADFNDLGRDELAIRAWYVGPDPSAVCSPAAPPIHAPTPPCDEARHWLLDDPTQLGSEVGQLRRNPEHWPRALNPVLPVDVPFEVPATWTGAVPDPLPVVVLGHFEDTRVDTYAGNVYFVLDALVWTRDRPSGTLDHLTNLTSAATEDPDAVHARIDAAAGTTAVATWTTVVDATNFAAFDPRAAESMPEFTRGAPVWVVRRLIENEMDGRQRLAVESAFTHDHGDRIWVTPTPDSSPELATTLDLDLPSGSAHVAGILKVVDQVDQVTSARIGDDSGVRSWRTIGPEGYTMRVGSTNEPRELVIEWKRPDCVAAWRLDITAGLWVGFSSSSDVGCRGRTPTYVIVEFDHPIDLRAVQTDEVMGGG